MFRHSVCNTTATSARDGVNTSTLPDDASKAPNVITGISTRTRASSHASFNSTTPALNETQIPNVVTGGDERATPQAAQPVAPQVNYNDDDDENDYNNVLPQNLDENGF